MQNKQSHRWKNPAALGAFCKLFPFNIHFAHKIALFMAGGIGAKIDHGYQIIGYADFNLVLSRCCIGREIDGKLLSVFSRHPFGNIGIRFKAIAGIFSNKANLQRDSVINRSNAGVFKMKRHFCMVAWYRCIRI